MLNRIKKLNQEGFTIIEVMIVLAIAGLIILIVLLAVPALQRNGRNTAIKNDASAITAGVSEFASNNDGATPTTIAQSGSTVTISGAAGTTPAEAKVQSSTTVSTTTAPGSDAGVIQVQFQKKCSSSTSFTAQTGSFKRSTMVTYNIETSSGVQPRCADS